MSIPVQDRSVEFINTSSLALRTQFLENNIPFFQKLDSEAGGTVPSKAEIKTANIMKPGRFTSIIIYKH
jgi:hypothetical protein